jgi:hypothetical protein
VRSNKVSSNKGPEARLQVGEKEVAELKCPEADTTGVKLAIRRIGHSQAAESGSFPGLLR